MSPRRSRPPSGRGPVTAPAAAVPAGSSDAGDLPIEVAAVRRAVLGWYRPDDRELPFRGTTDPWAVLVSEAMAQQTQAARAGQAWTSFMARYPDPGSLAAASPADVLRAWRGLGYNRRALALRAAAESIVRDHGGRVPGTVAELERLPGVGPYTARAVAAIAFGAAAGAVDTNVRRVLTRLVDPGGELGPRRLQELADRLVDPDRPGDWTHALMDLGATTCRAAAPDCPACPLRTWCRTADIGGEGLAGRPPAPTWLDRPGRRREIAAAERPTPFRSSSRWLRGRIVDRLRDAEDGRWVRFEGPIGEHPADAVGSALEALAREGLVELRDDDPLAARLPIAGG